MGRAPAEPGGGAAQRRLQPAAGDRGGLAAHARALPRAHAVRRGRAPAARAAAGGGRATCCCCCSARAGRSAAGSSASFGIELVFTRAGAALATAVMSFPLMVRAIRISLEHVDRGLEDAARTLGAGPLDRFLTDHSAAHVARRPGGRSDRVLGGTRRVRRGDHVRLEHPRRDAHPAARALHRAADARRRRASPRASPRCRSLWACAGCSRPKAWRARRAAGWAASCSSVRVELRRGDFALDVAFEAPTPGSDRALRPLRLRQDDRRARDRRPAHARDAGRIALDGEVFFGEGVERAARAPPHRLRVPGRAPVSAPERAGQPALRSCAARRARRGASRLDEVVDLLGLRALLARRPRQLSGRRTTPRRDRTRAARRSRGCCCSTSRSRRRTSRAAASCCRTSSACAASCACRSCT